MEPSLAVAEMTWAEPMRRLHVRGERETSSMHRKDEKIYEESLNWSPFNTIGVKITETEEQNQTIPSTNPSAIKTRDLIFQLETKEGRYQEGSMGSLDWGPSTPR